MTSTYSVSIATSEGWKVSNTFRTIREARNWAQHESAQTYCFDVAIYRGGPDGERVKWRAK